MIYYWATEQDHLLMLSIYAKNESKDLTRDQIQTLRQIVERVSMKEELFTELLESVHEGGAILRSEKSPSRKFTVEKPDVQKIRSNYRLSQTEFASMLGISKDTLQNWEQGRRQPQGPARVLLQVAAKHPEAVWDVVKPKKRLAGKKTPKKTKK